jgi:hypothetical protein
MIPQLVISLLPHYDRCYHRVYPVLAFTHGKEIKREANVASSCKKTVALDPSPKIPHSCSYLPKYINRTHLKVSASYPLLARQINASSEKMTNIRFIVIPFYLLSRTIQTAYFVIFVTLIYLLYLYYSCISCCLTTFSDTIMPNKCTLSRCWQSYNNISAPFM